MIHPRHISVRSLLTVIAMLAAVAMLAAGCGGSSDDTKSTDKAATETTTSTDSAATETTSTDAAATGEVIKVGIIAGKMKFDTDKIDAKAGSVTFEFNNTENVPHDFVIEKDGKKIGGTALITNDSETITVTLEPGEYEFFCTPHRAIGMTGVLTVS